MLFRRFNIVEFFIQSTVRKLYREILFMAILGHLIEDIAHQWIDLM